MSVFSAMSKKPMLIALVAGLIGLVLGLVWAWVVQPVEWANTTPNMLHPSFQEEYLRMAIDSYAANDDKVLALERWQALGSSASQILATVVASPKKQDPVAILDFNQLVQASGGFEMQPSPAAANGTTPMPWSYMIITVVIVVLGTVGFAAYRYLRPIRRGREVTPAQQAQDLSRQVEMIDYVARGEEPPIAQFVTTYVLGDDLFDDSFSIDSPAGEFMGECGVGISENIGVGDPKKVTAFEVWLFDKNDIQTVTKVLMSPHAFNDIATVQRLEAKGEPFLVERDGQVFLETAVLQLVATVAEVEYGQSALPENSYFERLTLELAIWPKSA